MSFEITITETKEVKKMCGQEWTVVGQEDIVSSEEPDIPIRTKPVYDYTPKIDKTVDVTVQVLQQTVETLDLPRVIKAINKLD